VVPKKTAVLCLLFVFALAGLSGTALAQLKYGTDFTTSEAVWSVTHIKVKSNMIPYYLDGRKNLGEPF
jgi:hypothetical protein